MDILDNLGKLNISLRDYQVDMIKELDSSESKRVLMQLETGTGKTVIFASYSILKAVLNNKRVLVIAGSEELIAQAIKTYKDILPNIDIGKFIGAHRNYDAQVVVASLQTLKNLHNLIVLDDDFDIVIYDEAHHAVSPTSKRIFYRYGVCDLDTAGYDNVELITPHLCPDRELIGVTATPERTDGTPLGKIFHERVDGPTIEWFIGEDYLSDMKFVGVDTGIDLSDVRSYMGDFSEKDIADKLLKSGYLNEIARVVDEYATWKKSILLYVPNVVTAKIAAKSLQDEGISADYVIGAERDRRKHVIERFKSGEIRVLVNCLVLKEGFDAPNTDCIILCRPTKSSLLLKQIIGRLTRPSPETGKDIGLFIDLGFKRRQMDIISASSIFEQADLQPSEQEDLSIKERLALQLERAETMGKLIYRLNRIRHEKEVAAATSPEPKVYTPPKEPGEEYYEDVPDTVKLLIDTRFLRKIGMSYKDFHTTFIEEMYKIRKNQSDLWMHDNSHPQQLRRLSTETGIPEEDLSIMTWLETQTMMHLLRGQKPITSSQEKYLRYLKSRKSELGINDKIWDGVMPKTSRLASQLINRLTGRGRSKRGRA